MAALLGVYAFVLSHNLRSIFLIVTFCWGWVAVAALFGRLEAIKAMSVTMVVLLLLTPLVMAVTPFGLGDTTAFYSLAWFPTLIAFGCTYYYALHLWQRDFEPNVSLDDLPSGLSMPRHPRSAIAMRLNADEFSQQMIDSAAEREQRTSEESADKRGAAGVPRLPQFKVLSAASGAVVSGPHRQRSPKELTVSVYASKGEAA
jgi:hypothetical protein